MESDRDYSKREREMREMWMELLRRDRDGSLPSFLAEEERRAVVYPYEKVPLEASYNPDNIPDAPFPEKKMKQLLDSANYKVLRTLLERRRNLGGSAEVLG